MDIFLAAKIVVHARAYITCQEIVSFAWEVSALPIPWIYHSKARN